MPAVQSVVLRRTVPLLLALLPACTDRFEEINTDPTRTSTPTSDQLFARALKYGSLYDNDFQVGEHLHANMWVQYFANSTPHFNTDRYESNDQWATTFWTTFYTGYGMDVQEVIGRVQADPAQVNRLSMARIWRAFLFQRITDYWGDVPYTAAFQGAATEIQPAYDSQQSIYTSLLQELQQAAAAFDDTQPLTFGAADLLYSNAGAANPVATPALAHQRWQRFANSLRLRMAMRLSEASPLLASLQARAALADGVMQSSQESAVMNNTGGSIRINQNPLSVVLGFNDSRISATLVDYLTRYHDPRLPVLVGPVSATNPARIGLANGLSATQLALPEYNPARYSSAGPRYLTPTNDQHLLTYAEVCFLRAEACLRGWDTSGSAEQWYYQGVREALALVDITDAAVVGAYLQDPAVRFTPGRALEQIITQKWLSLFGNNGFEAYAEYRRTGFPVLRSAANPGETGGAVPLRLRYPTVEQRLNSAAYQRAVSRQGPDLMTTPVWWDK
ncbi:SusD/RagB family nutrient-binding outer membrane lipoprotein [Hymenobacter metallilatus]|uniref:SusD/RagB family nutrient-binding outer membrane lipoprotein n=1 Tax=Hymenobacter metallilatus TaxID=2493666 RepID=A0A428JUI2_9BACT|nr:SusD/RagB family nutrient-binding outer membrane lipoprotein [Hymenobacter metallilatus]RSK37681.1 SusD/RagB family nutrient-binding outer membrane lipoprotein [Hymenobacter metallilatus]